METANEVIAGFPDAFLFTRTITMQTGVHDALHSHPWHQVIYPEMGLLRTRTQDKEYFVPSNRAVLIPANTTHESWAICRTNFIGLYLNPKVFEWSEHDCKIIEVSPLLRELVSYIAQLNLPQQALTPSEMRIVEVCRDQLLLQTEASLELLLPQDKRLLKITEMLLDNPADDTSISQWSQTVGASERTISRNFEKQTGLSFVKWRKRLRLIHCIKFLQEQLPIKEIAYRIGYHSASAFIHVFKKEFGITPSKYLELKHQKGDYNRL